MKNIVKGSIALAVGLFGLSAVSNAQTITTTPLVIVGSSAIYLEAGLAASASTANHGLNAVCVWNTTASNIVRVQDTTTGSNLFDTGATWIAWTPGTSGTCTAPTATAQVYAYVNTDSVVGNRAVYNSDTLQPGASANPTNTNTSGTIEGTGSTSVSEVPSNVWTNLSGATVNAAATDIRPEDAEFAITRALASCGTALTQYSDGTGSASQYLGLGYTSGTTINSYYSTSTFNVINFSLPSAFTVTPVGATAAVVAVNSTSASNSGFNSSAITNINRSTLALLLDGSISQTQDLLGSSPAGYTSEKVAVNIREPLSGTYNTMEYNIPNNVELQTSQDVGSSQPASTQNCNGTVPKWNSEGTSMTSLGGGARYRAIGTGQELNATFGTGGVTMAAANALGYGFWSAANFAAAPSTSKYLTVDGIDPLVASYSTTSGVIPTTSTELGNVTLTNVANGTYPIWTLLRLVNKGASASSLVSGLASAAQNFISATEPDFVPFTGSLYSKIPVLTVEHAHFNAPGIYTSTTLPQPTTFEATGTEAGNDVGGVVIPYNADADYASDVNSNGFVGTKIPSSLRRN